MGFIMRSDCESNVYAGLYVGLDGRPVEHPPYDYPYSYDAYVTYKHKSFRPTDHMDYSDRLWEFDPPKFRAAAAQVWPDTPHSQMFRDRKPADVERFLSLYFGKPVKLTAVLQGCNRGNGNPYWVFAYRDIGAAAE